MAIFPRTWICVGDKVYQGVSTDLGVLPTANVKAGTFAVCVDNGAVYGFSVKTSTWIEQPSNSKVLTSVENISTSVENIPTSIENISTSVENISTSVENIPTSIENISTSIGDIQTVLNNITGA